jgi:O-antigen ligase
VLYVSTFFLVRTFTKSEGEFFFNALVFSGAITAIIGIVQFMFYPNLGNLSYLEWDNHLYRLFSVFLDPNFAAVIFSLVFLYFLQRTITLWGRISIYFFLFLFGAIITALSVFLTFSRTGMLSLVVGVVVLLIIMKQTKALLVCVSLFILSFFLLADIGVEGLNPLRTVSTRARIESASIATNIFLKNPVLGVGFNAYRFAQHKYGFRTSNKWKTSHADAGTDNSFLFVLATTGIIGFVSFIALIFTTINAVYRQVQIKGAGIPEVTLASIATIFISSLLLHTLFYPFVMIWFWGMMGLTLRDEL